MSTAAELAELKLYLRIDGDGEDGLISALAEAAQQYMSEAGIPYEPDRMIWQLCRNQLVLNYYETRDGVAKLPAGLQALINQLKAGGIGGSG